MLARMLARFLEPQDRRHGHVCMGAMGAMGAIAAALGLWLGPLAATAASPAPAHPPPHPQQPLAVADLGHANGVSSLAVARAGNLLATGGTDGLIKLWDVASGRLIRNFPMHGLVNSLAFTAGDRELVGSDSDGELAIWELATGTRRRRWRRPQAPGFPQVESDGTTVEATRVQAGSLVTVRSPRGAELARLPLPAANPELALDPGHRWVAFSGPQQPVELRPLAGRAPAPRLDNAPQNVVELRFSPDGLLLGASDEDDAVTFWDLRDGHRLRTVSCAELAGKSSKYYPCFFNFLPDGRRAAIAFIDHVEVLDPRTGARGASWSVPQAELGRLVPATDGSALFVESGNGVEILGLAPGAGRRRIEGRQSTIATLAFGAGDDRLLAAGQRPDDGVTLWDLERGRPVLIHPLSRHSFSLAAVSRDSRFFAVSDTGDSTGIEVWDAERRATRRQLPPPGFAVGALALSDDAEVVAAGGADPQKPANEIALYRPGTAAPCILPGSPKSIWNLALSSDRRWLASASGYPTTPYGSLKLWEVATCQLHQDLLGPMATVAAVAFGGRDTYAVPPGIPPVRPRAYLITVGVSENQNPAWRLRYAARDARLLATAMAAPLAARGYEVVTVALVSPRPADGPAPGEVLPTKANLRATLAALSALAGGDPAAAAKPSGVLAAAGASLRPTLPDDLVLLFVAAHGDTDAEGRLDLYPYDLGAAGPVPPARRISSDELASWLRDLDAGQLILILDTCRAGAVTGRGFRAGPMGDPGLGQLAYDLRARILAAAQADAEATGSFVLQQGLLTYALAHEALGQLPHSDQAAFPWGAWLRHAERRVPELFREYVAADHSRKPQLPALFDFAESAADLIVPPEPAVVPTPQSR